MCGKLRAGSASLLGWMLRIHAHHTPAKLKGVPLTKTQSLQLKLLVLTGDLRLLGSTSDFVPSWGPLTAQHISSLCPRETHQPSTVAEESLASECKELLWNSGKKEG